MVGQLIQRADKAAEERKALLATKSNQDMAVQQFCSYLSTQLVEISSDMWFDFTIEAQRLVHNYVTQSKQRSQLASSHVYQQQHLPQQQQQHLSPYPARLNSISPSASIWAPQHVPMNLGNVYSQHQYQLPKQGTYPATVSTASGLSPTLTVSPSPTVDVPNIAQALSLAID